MLLDGYPEILGDVKAVERVIKKATKSRNALLSSIVDELISAGGKRLRPAFVIMSSRFGNYDREKVLQAAGALEILHTATLIHDDVIDGSQLRRGKATVAEKYGTAMAIYTGDFLFTKAVAMFAECVPPDRVDMVAKAVKVICEGEVDQYRDRFNMNTGVVTYLKRIIRKTAMLFGAACSLGAYQGDCPRDTARSLTRFGIIYGTAFQIKDDINDYAMSEKSAGKSVNNDIANGVITLPAIYALKRCGQIKEIFDEAFGKAGQISASDVSEAARLVREYGGVSDSEKLLRKYVAKGLKELDKLPENRSRHAFKELISMLLD